MLEQVVTSASQVNHLISETASASQEQSLGIEQANKTINKMDKMNQENTRLVQDTIKVSTLMN